MELTITITPPDEFRFAPNLAYLTRSPAECLYRVEDGRVLTLQTFEGIDVLQEVSSPDDHLLQLRFLGTDVPLKKSVQEAAVQYVRDWFDLETNLSSFYRIAATDPLLQDVVRDWNGLRVIGVPNLFEALCWSIMGQQINLGFAYTLKKRFVESFGRSVTVDGSAYWSFPTPETVAALSVEQLRELQFTNKKAEYVIGVAGLFAAGRLSKQSLQELGDFAAMEKELVRIRGIGPWSAHYVLMRCFRNPSAFPVQDVGLQNAVKAALGMDRKPTLEELHDLSVNWADWKAYATFYLWMTLYGKID
jgi:DNA-3-methyladenine glycosylase II